MRIVKLRIREGKYIANILKVASKMTFLTSKLIVCKRKMLKSSFWICRLGISVIGSFKGIARRMEVVFCRRNCVIRRVRRKNLGVIRIFI